MAKAHDPADPYRRDLDLWMQGKQAAHALLEKPAMFALLPPLEGKTVLCLGCGAGEECAALAMRGAVQVTGIDASHEQIAHAREQVPTGTFHVMNMEQLALPDHSFDFGYASLALHYLDDWTTALRELRRVLRPGAEFLCSVIHPAHWACTVQRSADGRDESFMLGYSVRGAYEAGETFGDYFTARWIEDCWYGGFRVRYHYKPLTQMLGAFRTAGFGLLDCREPVPVEAARATHPVWYAIWSRIPQFLIFRLKSPG